MPDVPAVTSTFGADFLPMLGGGVAAPLLANMIPGLNQLSGPAATGAVGLGLALMGKGAWKRAGQGALLISSVGFLGNIIGGLDKGAGDAFDL